MGERLRNRGRVGWFSFALLLLSPAAQAQTIPPGRVLPLAVRQGRYEVVLPAAGPADKFYLILGSLARRPGPWAVTVRTAACADPVSLSLEDSAPDDAWVRKVGAVRERLTLAREQQGPGDEPPPSAAPPPQRVFHVFVGEHDFQDPAGYAEVTGELRAFGRYCQVYVDRDHPDPAGLQPTLDDVVHTFDEEVYPRARQSLGRVLDVDRDGRFTILFSGRLGKLAGGKVSLEGFVRGSDFYADLPDPFGNRCDMMYLNTDLKPGPFLRTLLAHEYTHAVVFSEHVFGPGPPGPARQDEEGWLNEALAHLAEDHNGYSWENLDYRLSAFLNAPERYQLVVPDYYAAGLWRSHGSRGACYLFLRWCTDRCGPDLAGRLIRSPLNGVANLEAAAGEPFADLFRQWSAALVLSGTNLVADGRNGPPYSALKGVDLHRPLAGRLLCGPRYESLEMAGGYRELRLAGTTTAAVLLHSPAGDRCRLTVLADPDAALQASLVRLPEGTARLSLRHEGVPGSPGSIRLVLTARDAGVTVDGAAWERLTPAANRPEDTSYRAGEAPDASARAWFGDLALKAGETRTSVPIRAPDFGAVEGTVVFKVSATDQAGHHLAAWDLLEPERTRGRGTGEGATERGW